jgi:hypothetical protein
MALMTPLPVQILSTRVEGDGELTLFSSWARRTPSNSVIFSNAKQRNNGPCQPCSRVPPPVASERAPSRVLACRSLWSMTPWARTVVRHDDAIHMGIHRSVGIIDCLNALEHDGAVQYTSRVTVSRVSTHSNLRIRDKLRSTHSLFSRLSGAARGGTLPSLGSARTCHIYHIYRARLIEA